MRLIETIREMYLSVKKVESDHRFVEDGIRSKEFGYVFDVGTLGGVPGRVRR